MSRRRRRPKYPVNRRRWRRTRRSWRRCWRRRRRRPAVRERRRKPPNGDDPARAAHSRTTRTGSSVWAARWAYHPERYPRRYSWAAAHAVHPAWVRWYRSTAGVPVVATGAARRLNRAAHTGVRVGQPTRSAATAAPRERSGRPGRPSATTRGGRPRRTNRPGGLAGRSTGGVFHPVRRIKSGPPTPEVSVDTAVRAGRP